MAEHLGHPLDIWGVGLLAVTMVVSDLSQHTEGVASQRRDPTMATRGCRARRSRSRTMTPEQHRGAITGRIAERAPAAPRTPCRGWSREGRSLHNRGEYPIRGTFRFRRCGSGSVLIATRCRCALRQIRDRAASALPQDGMTEISIAAKVMLGSRSDAYRTSYSPGSSGATSLMGLPPVTYS